MKAGCVLLIALAMAFLLGSVAVRAESSVPKVGDKAPLFAGKDQDGKVWRLADVLRKQAVLLYFYPKDDTPGCTKEACGFRDRMDGIKQAGVQLIGVSFDSGESHRSFIAKHSLHFPLLADTEGKIADSYGVRIAGKPMAKRVSFLIGKDGKIHHVTDSPNADLHLAEMQEAISKLKGP